ncbi:hypothetical protein DBY21_00620 [Candidatus Gastranaerophilales bacterium]|nr:MAG: hypothetical protein DBY21_00620 [Candidatus Gastranaerophilales bacterium]
MVIINIYNVKWKRRYTRKELCELTGISPATLTKLTKGEHVDVKISTLEKLAKFFGCRVVDLIEEIPD